MKAEDIVIILNNVIKTYRANNNISSNSLLVLQRTVEVSSSFMKALKTYKCIVWYVDLEKNVRKIAFTSEYCTSLSSEYAWNMTDMGITEVIINSISSPLFEQIRKGEYDKHSNE